MYRDPMFLIIIDEQTKELEEAVERLPLPTKVLEFKTFVRENAGITFHAHLFEPLFRLGATPSETIPPSPPLGRAKAGDTIEVPITTQAPRKYSLFYVNRKHRPFFPGYKQIFILETDIGDIETKVSASDAGTHPQKGDLNAGRYVHGGLKEWYDRHPELTIGRRVRFVCVEPYKKYRLLIV